jgi:hypothetical protein
MIKHEKFGLENSSAKNYLDVETRTPRSKGPPKSLRKPIFEMNLRGRGFAEERYPSLLGRD